MARTGRPRQGDDVKRAPLNMRTTPALREKIEEAAAANGYSLTQEIERRLLSSFNEDTWMGGSHIRGFVKMLGAVIDRIESRTGKRWIDDIETWGAVQAATNRLLQWDRPNGSEMDRRIGALAQKSIEAFEEILAARDALDNFRR